MSLVALTDRQLSILPSLLSLGYSSSRKRLTIMLLSTLTSSCRSGGRRKRRHPSARYKVSGDMTELNS